MRLANRSLRPTSLGAELPEDLAKHAEEEFGIGGVEVEAVDKTTDFRFVKFGGGFGEVAAGLERVEEQGGEALEVSSGSEGRSGR